MNISAGPGVAIREFPLTAGTTEGRLDRFDRPGEGPHPTCMHFDNLTVNYARPRGSRIPPHQGQQVCVGC